MVTSLHREDEVYRAVEWGELEIAISGEIWRIARRGWDRWKGQTVTRTCKRVRAENDIGDYLAVRAMFDKIRYHALAHRLVWRHFKGPIPGSLTVNHKDGNKKRNVLENLELATVSEQQIHALRILKRGRAIRQWGTSNAMSKLSDEQVLQIKRRRAAGEKLRLIAKDMRVHLSTISAIALGNSRREFRGA